jgi:hypothetical protein
MAAVAYAFPFPLGLDVFGKPQVEVKYFITDPALQGDGSGHDARIISLVVTLDPLDPFGWDAAIEDAIIADAAAQPQPFTVSAFRCLTMVYSDSLLKESHLFQQPATGFDITIGNNVRTLLLNPAGTLATGTITMPGNPQNGRSVKIASSQTITLLSLNPNTGQSFAAGAAITTLLANGFAEYTYRGANNTWYRVG